MSDLSPKVSDNPQPLPIAQSPEEPLEVLLRAGIVEGFHLSQQLKDSIPAKAPDKRRRKRELTGNAPDVTQFERGAEIQLQKWRDSGLLPPEVSRCAVEDSNTGSTEDCPHGSPLLLRVAHIFREFFAWEGRLLLNADIVVDKLEDKDEDQLADRLADFLWTNRHILEC